VYYRQQSDTLLLSLRLIHYFKMEHQTGKGKLYPLPTAQIELYIVHMESIRELMEAHDKAVRDGAFDYIKKRDEKNPPVQAPYIMKYSAECDYFK